MKKFLKSLFIILMLAMVLVLSVQPITLAAEETGTSSAATTIDNLENKKGGNIPQDVTDVGGTIINWIWGISIVVAVIVLMIIGLKFIIGSTEEKAKYKESLIPLVVGILILVFATTIIKILYSING